MKLSEMPWNALHLGMKVTSAVGNPGQITELEWHKDPDFCYVAITWDHGAYSYQSHQMLNKVTVD